MTAKSRMMIDDAHRRHSPSRRRPGDNRWRRPAVDFAPGRSRRSGAGRSNRADEKARAPGAARARAWPRPRCASPAPCPRPSRCCIRRVRAAGDWLAERQVFIDNQIHEGRAGFHVVTPLAHRGRRRRGAREPRLDRARRAPIRARRRWPSPEGRVDGRRASRRVPPARFVELSAETVAGQRVAEPLDRALRRAQRASRCFPWWSSPIAPAPGLAPRDARSPTRASPSTASTRSPGSRSPRRCSRCGSRST